jgi:hypothetical protein
MPIVRVEGLPSQVPGGTLGDLRERIIDAILGIKELELNNRRHVIPRFSKDRLACPINGDINYIVYLTAKPNRTQDVLGQASSAVRDVLSKTFPLAFVEGWCEPIDKLKNGYRSTRG